MWRLSVLVSCLFVVAIVGSSSWGQSPPKTETKDVAGPVLNEQEKAFVELMTGCVLVGKFTIDGQDDIGSKPDRYAIAKVRKDKGDDWIIEAKMDFGNVDVPIPVPVKMNWVAGTPVLSVTDLSIPLLGGGFGARILFDGKRYAGTWSHNEVGGHMWGYVERDEAKAKDVGKPAKGAKGADAKGPKEPAKK